MLCYSKYISHHLLQYFDHNLDHFQYQGAKKVGGSQSAIYHALRGLKISCRKNAISHPKADGLKRLIFQLQIFSYEFMAPGPMVYVDERGLALDEPRDRGCARRVKIGNCHWSHNGLQTIESFPI